MSDPDRRRLPIRRPPFGGVGNRTLERVAAGLGPDRASRRRPTGAPNVLLVLIDDAGFGNPSTFGGPIQHAATTRGWPRRACGTTASTSPPCARRRGRRC